MKHEVNSETCLNLFIKVCKEYIFYLRPSKVYNVPT